ncbi:MAG: phosphoribosylglycinamide formyltransferase [Eubacteriales bacterium]|jgi:phosphoribosylglycinamide formyltransferase-1|nr:phosphoribosylglycinamide formyltransferase [Bacillota bacterium]MBV1726554.1 phosphoribosylglycinamide formyltransferase [Desulforudis sp.]MDP3049863.1 phosphoribosylglycinamide formyltransferase [Eubacteriales bacterium]MDQ7788620.1 phosphoribosylglycinamide formyltransferase [Clostridia bacterium]MBU4532084.1 phosphoribosylglycinamide formyltransferase [Bacillota bacterium]
MEVRDDHRSQLKIGVLASGRGSNLQAILDATLDGRLPAEVAVVISDDPQAYALERARTHGIPLHSVELAGKPSKQAYEEEIVRILREHGVGLVCLAGYMRIVSPVMLRAFPNRMINIHPSLLPSFPGLHAQRQALDYGVRFSGCTVHFVDEGVDSGPIIIQAVVPVLQDDTEDTLSARILEQEHRIYVEAVRLYALGKLTIKGRKVCYDNPTK